MRANRDSRNPRNPQEIRPVMTGRHAARERSVYGSPHSCCFGVHPKLQMSLAIGDDTPVQPTKLPAFPRQLSIACWPRRCFHCSFGPRSSSTPRRKLPACIAGVEVNAVSLRPSFQSRNYLRYKKSEPQLSKANRCLVRCEFRTSSSIKTANSVSSEPGAPRSS
jgi:hypothetical protein